MAPAKMPVSSDNSTWTVRATHEIAASRRLVEFQTFKNGDHIQLSSTNVSRIGLIYFCGPVPDSYPSLRLCTSPTAHESFFLFCPRRPNRPKPTEHSATHFSNRQTTGTPCFESNKSRSSYESRKYSTGAELKDIYELLCALPRRPRSSLPPKLKQNMQYRPKYSHSPASVNTFDD